jgi:hypothetical protein
MHFEPGEIETFSRRHGQYPEPVLLIPHKTISKSHILSMALPNPI